MQLPPPLPHQKKKPNNNNMPSIRLYGYSEHQHNEEMSEIYQEGKKK